MLYIQSRADMTLGVIEEFYNDTHQMILSSGVSSYTFTVAKNIEDSQYLVEGNYVIITDDQGLGWKFTIMNTTQTHTEITVYCEDIGLELVNKVMDAWNAPTTKQPASYYINKAIKDTKWKIGFNQISNLSRTLKWEGRDTSLNRLLSICTEFDHAEIEFRVKFHNLQVTDYIINIYKSRGANRSDIQLVYGETVDDITKSSSIEELATAMMGVGSDKELPENAPQGAIPDKVTFKNLTYDDGFFFTKAGDSFLRARVANQQFNLREGYIEDYYEYDTSDPQELLNRTITQLKERSEIKVNYEVSAVKFDKSLQLGDTITIIDHDYKPELLLSGRVLELDKSYTDASQDKLVLGNFLILYSNINDKLYNLQNQIKNMKVDSNYMWLRYAIDDKGTGMSATPTAGTKYFAMLVNKKTGVPSDNPADYAGHWKLIQGEDGKDGVAGEKGADGKTSYTHFAYANDVSGHSDFSLDDPTGRAYMGVFSDFTKADSTNPDDYIWSLTKGEDGEQGIQGLQGPQGTKGIAGPKGADGKTQYTHIAYSNSADGKTDFSQTPANHKYIGMYVDFIEDDSNDPTKYGWSLIKGEDGLDGAQGIAGKPGADGKTSYTHIAYADTATGSGFSQSPNNKKYIGMYVDFTENDSGDPMKYAWSLIKGDDGKDGIAGKDGVGIKSTQIMYAQSTSGTTAPTAGWTAQVPTLIKGQYLWTQTTWLYTDNTGEAGYTVSYNAKDGNTGADGRAGKDGVGISATKVEYVGSTSGTNKPTNGWLTTVPSVEAGNFLWTKTTWSYTDGTSEFGYSVAKMGEKGDKGDSAKTIKVTSVSYQLSPNPLPGVWIGGKEVPGIYPGASYNSWGRGHNLVVVNKDTFQAETVKTYDDYQAPTIADTLASDITALVDKVVIVFAIDASSMTTALRNALNACGGNPDIAPYTNMRASHIFIGMSKDSTGKYPLALRQGYEVLDTSDSANRTLYATQSGFGIATNGSDGKNGIPGKPGADGKTPYFHTAWATSADGKNGFSITDSANKTYLGTYTDFTKPDSTDTTKYAWSLIKGRDGTNGTPGKPGADGKTPYFHTAWADSKDGKINFSLNDATNRGYLGTYTDFEQADSSDPTKYSWVELVGNLQVGGRNYFLDSKTRIITPPGTANYDWRINISDGFWSNSDRLKSNNIRVSFTLTAKKALTTDFNSALYFSAPPWYSVNFSYPAGTTAPKKYELVFNITDSAFKTDNCFIRFQAKDTSANPFVLENAELEIGTTSTDWSPAPEDTQGQIDSVNKALVQANNKINEVPHVSAQSSAPANPKQGDQWWVLDESGKATGFKVWSGTAWNDSKIQQSLLNVVSLNAVTITGSTINGSKFTNNFDFTNIEKIRFQGVTTIGDGAVNITWKLPVNNQTGQSLMNASGFQSDINAPNGTRLHHVGLVMGLLEMTDWLSGSGAGAKFLTGVLDAQDAYHAETTAVQWLSGWGDWGNGNGLIHVSRNGRTVSVSGYPHHNNSANFSEVCNLPAWARPIQTVNISGTVYDSGVMNPAPCKITIDKNGKIQVTNGKKGGYLIIGGTYTGQDIR